MFPLGICSGLQLQDHRACMCADVAHATQSFSTWLYQLTEPLLHSLLQWVPLQEEYCRKCSQDSGIRLPENFSINQIFGKAVSARKISHPMLQAALALKKKGKDPVWPLSNSVTPEALEGWVRIHLNVFDKSPEP